MGCIHQINAIRSCLSKTASMESLFCFLALEIGREFNLIVGELFSCCPDGILDLTDVICNSPPSTEFLLILHGLDVHDGILLHSSHTFEFTQSSDFSFEVISFKLKNREAGGEGTIFLEPPQLAGLALALPLLVAAAVILTAAAVGLLRLGPLELLRLAVRNLLLLHLLPWFLGMRHHFFMTAFSRVGNEECLGVTAVPEVVGIDCFFIGEDVEVRVRGREVTGGRGGADAGGCCYAEAESERSFGEKRHVSG
mmetsp:Transcript_11101/g.16641  ORF Transcript_11101/g.16641 Transcript_11101/m.16641 type:complete len:253 (+) Transcript_11101:3672-4430(+)